MSFVPMPHSDCTILVLAIERKSCILLERRRLPPSVAKRGLLVMGLISLCPNTPLGHPVLKTTAINAVEKHTQNLAASDRQEESRKTVESHG